MNSRELLSLLQKEAREILIKDFVKKDTNVTQQDVYPPGSMQYITALMTKYDLEIFSQIKHRKDISAVEDIKPNLIKDFTYRINCYMDENAPGQPNLKRYVRIISLYLTFIAKKPLHPPGMVMSKGSMIINKSGKFYCPLKRNQLQEKLSLCAYCVSKDITEML